MKDTFDTAFDLVIGSEGGFQKDYHDRGNWTSGKVGQGSLMGTKYGVTAMNYPQYDIENLTLEQAKEIYRKDYWEPILADLMPAGVDNMSFDIAVNHGKRDAIMFTQEAVGAAVDGIVGPETTEKVREANPFTTLARLVRIRQYDYTNISTWGRYGKGWSRRNVNVLEESVELLMAHSESNDEEQDKAAELVFGGLFRKVS